MDWNEIVWLIYQPFPLSCYCQLLLDLASCFFCEVRVIAFVPYGTELSFSHLVYFLLPKIVCICFASLCFFLLGTKYVAYNENVFQ